MRHQSQMGRMLQVLLLSCLASLAAVADDHAVPAGKVRIAITRSPAIQYMALSARVEVNGQQVVSLGRGDTYSGDFDAGRLVITADHWSSPGKFSVALNGESGAEYKVELSPREDSFLPGALFGLAGLAVDAAVQANAGLFKLVIQDVQRAAGSGTVDNIEPSSTFTPTVPLEESSPAPDDPPNIEQDLAELKRLYDKGLLSHEIYLEKQRELVGRGR